MDANNEAIKRALEVAELEMKALYSRCGYLSSNALKIVQDAIILASQPTAQNKSNGFLAFCGDDYYPSGGATDLLDSFDTLEKAIDFLEKKQEVRLSSWDWAHVYDIQAKEIVWERRI